MYYDSVKDPIRRYFLEKIQICVSSSAAMNALSKMDSDSNGAKRKMTTTTDSDPSEEDAEIAELEIKIKKIKAMKKERRHSRLQLIRHQHAKTSP